jgi:hypothetical protein
MEHKLNDLIEDMDDHAHHDDSLEVNILSASLDTNHIMNLNSKPSDLFTMESSIFNNCNKL